MCPNLWLCIKVITVIISLDGINACGLTEGQISCTKLKSWEHDVLHPANIHLLIQFYAAVFRLQSSEAPCCWHCYVIHFAVNVIHLLLLCYPTVLVDIIEECVRWAEWNPNEGAAQSDRKATPAQTVRCSSIRRLLMCTYRFSTGERHVKIPFV